MLCCVNASKCNLIVWKPKINIKGTEAAKMWKEEFFKLDINVIFSFFILELNNCYVKYFLVH